MSEKEPKYFKDFCIRLDKKFDEKFEEQRKWTKEYVETSISELAQVTSRQFDLVYKRFDEIDYRISNLEQNSATKADVEKILKHIGRYEIRAQNTEEVLLRDHKPRIKDLESEVFG